MDPACGGRSAGRLAGRDHRAAALGAALQELSKFRRRLRRPRQLHSLLLDANAVWIDLQQLRGCNSNHLDRDPTGICLCLRTYAQSHAAQRSVLCGRHAPAVCAVAAVGHFADLPVRQSGPAQTISVRRLHIRPHRDHHRAGVLLFSACADHRCHRIAAVGCPAIRGRRCSRHIQGAHFSHRNAAGRKVRHSQCRVRRVHAGGNRFRHCQGDRRPVQRAGDGCLQAGRGPAEFRDGRGRRHGAAAACGAGLCYRSAGAESPSCAAVRARRTVRAQAQRRARCGTDDLLPFRRGYSDHRPWHRNLGLFHHLLAVQSDAHP